jgi:hypothetical protein
MRFSPIGHLAFVVATAIAPVFALAMPEPVIPCHEALAGTSKDDYPVLIRETRARHLQYCAADVLVERGRSAAEFAIALMQQPDRDVAEVGLYMVMRLGPLAESAFPAVLALLRVPQTDVPGQEMFDYTLFSAVSALGKSAKPAIAHLLAEAAGNGPRAHRAIAALGALGQYDRAIVIRHLVRLLRLPERENDAASALRTMGKAARPALPALMARLNAAIAGGGKTEHLIVAVGAIEDPARSVPLLVRYLGDPNLAEPAATALFWLGAEGAAAVPALLRAIDATDPGAPAMDSLIRALHGVAPASIVVQERLLSEATQRGSEAALEYLVRIDPLPAQFAPVLRVAIEREPRRWKLHQALRQSTK